jgi:hypothetical protein
LIGALTGCASVAVTDPQTLKGRAISDLFGIAGPHLATKPLTVFRADLLGSVEAS